MTGYGFDLQDQAATSMFDRPSPRDGGDPADSGVDRFDPFDGLNTDTCVDCEHLVIDHDGRTGCGECGCDRTNFTEGEPWD